MSNKLLTIMFLLMILVSTTSAEVMDYPYVIIQEAKDPELVVTDSMFYEISRKVIFPVNKYNIPRNSEFRKELTNEILPHFNNINYRLARVIIRGAASPEGTYEWNKILSERRLASLLEIINENSKISTVGLLKSNEVPEDYIYLLRLMKEENDKDYDRVAAIVNRYINSDLKTLKLEMRRLDYGRVWYRLLWHYFPEMRAARVVLIFRKTIDLNIEIIKSDTISDFEVAEVIVPDTLPIIIPQRERQRIPRRELLSVRTNLLFDFAYVPGYDRWCPIPNVAIEYYPLHGHFTYGASFDFPWWQHYWDHKYFQIRNYQLETRYYLRSGDVDKRGIGNGPAFTGWYAKAYLHGGLYSLCFDADRGWIGEGFGGGLGLGYVMPLNKDGRWRLEFGAQFGYFWTKYDPFQYECPVDPTLQDHLYYYKWTLPSELFKKRQYRWNWIGPTRIDISVSYDLFFRKRYKKGFGFRNWQWTE